MIDNKNKFAAAVVVLLLAVILAIQFPDRWTVAQSLFQTVGLPVTLAGGFQLPGVLILGVMIIGVILLTQSVKKRQGLYGVIAVLVVLIGPWVLVNLYQGAFAEGIDAVSYDRDESSCSFAMHGESVLRSRCEVALHNHSDSPVSFDIHFKEDTLQLDDVPTVSLLNQDGPFRIRLDGREQRTVVLEKDIDVSGVPSHADSAEVWGVDIRISEGTKSREL
ncbi:MULTISPECIES: hypothetical protein [Sporosarcina]|uniref:hypothetical protein n=1 Tax=Sporosarcina TaxID=1569 RepID=UPI000590FB44|nr:MULTISPECIES: hypothetical protein [Sporosarcina]WJY28079.1 hypothetical protein QWT68_03605 [Sporosarcina sp. 0.2-SM1T-5]